MRYARAADAMAFRPCVRAAASPTSRSSSACRMNFESREEQGLLPDMVRRFLADRGDAACIGGAPMPRAAWRALGELGLFAFLLPERGGGMGGRAQDVMIV